MKISNVNTYGLNESIVASGYPMKTEIQEEMLVRPSEFNRDIKRAKSLGNAEPNSGHDCMLKGIIVQFDLKAPEYFWRQFDRYHFHDYISSQSKMHCITKMNIDEMCNKYVDYKVIDILKEYIKEYNTITNLINNEIYIDKYLFNARKEHQKEMFQCIMSNCPMGLELTARITSNYLQEKSIRNQRKNHKLEEWNYYCNWQDLLPMFKELVLED